MGKTVSLTASADYGLSGQYIARITGRDQKYTFSRSFLGRKTGKRNETTEEIIDEPGLYEVCNIDKKRGKESHFYAMVMVEENLRFPSITKAEAMEIAKRMDAGESIQDIVAYDLTKEPGERHSIRSKAEAAKTVAAVTVDQAKQACWDILQKLDTKTAKKVLAELKTLVSPPSPKDVPASEPVTEQATEQETTEAANA